MDGCQAENSHLGEQSTQERQEQIDLDDKVEVQSLGLSELYTQMPEKQHPQTALSCIDCNWIK